MGPLISRQPHQMVKVPIPTGEKFFPADEGIRFSLRVTGRFFVLIILKNLIYRRKR